MVALDNSSVFSRDTKLYEQTHDAFPDEFVTRVLDDIVAASGKEFKQLRIIDMGAGTGRLGKAFLEKEAYVTFVDPDPKMVATLQEKYGNSEKATIIQGSAENPNINKKGEADLIVMGDCSHFIDEKLAVPQFKKLLKPGGKIATFGSLWADENCVTLKLRELLESEYPHLYSAQNPPLYRDKNTYYGYQFLNKNHKELLVQEHNYARSFTQEKFLAYAKTTPQLGAINESEERFQKKIVKPLWETFKKGDNEALDTYFEVISVSGDRRKTKAEEVLQTPPNSEVKILGK
jgi:SAM-dependent methyltransferase